MWLNLAINALFQSVFESIHSAITEEQVFEENSRFIVFCDVTKVQSVNLCNIDTCIPHKLSSICLYLKFSWLIQRNIVNFLLKQASKCASSGVCAGGRGVWANPLFSWSKETIEFTLLVNVFTAIQRVVSIWVQLIAYKYFFHTIYQAFIQQISVVRVASWPRYTSPLYISALVHMHFCTTLEPLCLILICNYPAWTNYNLLKLRQFMDNVWQIKLRHSTIQTPL